MVPILQDFLESTCVNHATTTGHAAIGVRVGACMSMGSRASERNSKQQVVIERPPVPNFISQS